MPRLSPQLFRLARRHSAQVAILLPACRDIRSAINELRWIKQHVDQNITQSNRDVKLDQLCKERGRGVPLQYVLGSQPFGSLDIKCRPEVLIPRPETEAYVCHLVDLIRAGEVLDSRFSDPDDGLTIIDFCTGTGCIPLLLFSSLQKSMKHLQVHGVDISPSAIELAQRNLAHNLRLQHMSQPGENQVISFRKADIFDNVEIQKLARLGPDIIISNPPYISKDVWNHGRGHLGYSVRKYEPRLALVPGDHLPSAHKPLRQEDVFYGRLLDVALVLNPKILLLEIGEEEQAQRVVQYCIIHAYSNGAEIQIWRDWPDLEPSDAEQQQQRQPLKVRTSDGREQVFGTKGSGNIRSIVLVKKATESSASEST